MNNRIVELMDRWCICFVPSACAYPRLLPAYERTEKKRMSHLSTRLTYEELALLPNDGKRHELLDGDHFMTPSPNTRHRRVLSRLHDALMSFLDRHPLGELFIAPSDVVMSPHDVCEPDLVFVSKDRSSIVTDSNIQGVPTLLVEVLSPGTRKLDEVYKRDRYARPA